MKTMFTIFTMMSVILVQEPFSRACTNFLVTKGASADGSTMVSYAADSHVLYGELYYTPSADHPEGSMLDIYEWDTGDYLGKIEQVRHTFEVVGNMNEHQVVIGETTWGGREELQGQKATMDYGSLIYITLQRARTAREAVHIMGDLVAKYGYRSEGESFSIADAKEVWFMDMIGKGPKEKGAVWVARKIPDGYISAHANQARIRTFPLRSRDTIYSPDVISFARKKGYFKGRDRDFSFADAYAPMSFEALRICEARVWAMFRRAAPSKRDRWTRWIMGDMKAPRLPLWIKPDKKLSVQDMMSLMRDHFEGTPFDLSKGVGAGPYQLPYRWRPLYWEVDGKKYFNERATSTQQTGFSFITQSRSFLPAPIGGLIWFGVDDTYSTVYVPMYSGIRKIPKPYAVGTADFQHFSWDSAFWVFNWVSNFAYGRYMDMIKDIQVVQGNLEGSFLSRQPQVEKAAVKLYRQAPELAREYLTRYSDEQANKVVDRWRKLGQQLLVKYLDGNVRDEHGKVTHPGYPKQWYRRIVKDSGDHFYKRRLPGEPEEKKHEQKNNCPCPTH